MTAPSTKLAAFGRSSAAPPLLLILLTLATFGRTVCYGFVWDDWLVLVRNPRLNPPSLAGMGYYWTHPAWNLYMPIATTAWAALAAITSPISPTVFHAANVLLQAAVVVGLYRVLLRLVQHPWPAAAGAALFAVHPIQVEVVSFVGALNTLLCAAFALPALCDYLDAGGAASPAGSRWLLGRCAVLLLLATLCKPIAVVVPIFAIILDRLVRQRHWPSVVRSAWPLVLAVLPCLIWTKLIQPPRPIAGAAAPLSFRPVIAADTIAQYFHLVFWPVHLCVDYGRSPGWLYQHPSHAVDGLATVAILILAVLLRRHLPYLAAGILIFVVGFVPVSGLVSFDFQQYSTVGDRYAYLPMLGVALAGAWLADRAARLLPRPLVAGALVLFFIALGAMSNAQSTVWRDDRTLFSQVLRVNPGSWLGHENLAVALLQTAPAPADAAAAAAEARAAIQLQPADADGYAALVEAELAARNPAAAVEAAKRGLSRDESSVELHRLLAIALDQTTDNAGAIAAFEQYLSVEPRDAAAQTNLAADLANAGRFSEAREHYLLALQLDPGSVAAAAGVARIDRRAGAAR